MSFFSSDNFRLILKCSVPTLYSFCRPAFRGAVLHLQKAPGAWFSIPLRPRPAGFPARLHGQPFQQNPCRLGKDSLSERQQFFYIFIFCKKLFVLSFHSSGVLLSPGSFPRQSYLRFPARIHKSASASGPCRRDGLHLLSKGAPWKG